MRQLFIQGMNSICPQHPENHPMAPKLEKMVFDFYFDPLDNISGKSFTELMDLGANILDIATKNKFVPYSPEDIANLALLIHNDNKNDDENVGGNAGRLLMVIRLRSIVHNHIKWRCETNPPLWNSRVPQPPMMFSLPDLKIENFKGFLTLAKMETKDMPQSYKYILEAQKWRYSISRTDDPNASIMNELSVDPKAPNYCLGFVLFKGLMVGNLPLPMDSHYTKKPSSQKRSLEETSLENAVIQRQVSIQASIQAFQHQAKKPCLMTTTTTTTTSTN
jgi:hypothetical protein